MAYFLENIITETNRALVCFIKHTLDLIFARMTKYTSIMGPSSTTPTPTFQKFPPSNHFYYIYIYIYWNMILWYLLSYTLQNTSNDVRISENQKKVRFLHKKN